MPPACNVTATKVLQSSFAKSYRKLSCCGFWNREDGGTVTHCNRRSGGPEWVEQPVFAREDQGSNPGTDSCDALCGPQAVAVLARLI